MLELVVWFVAGLVMIVLEYFLTVKVRSPLWGAILPVGTLIAAIGVFMVGRLPMNLQTLMPFGILAVLLFGEWSSGRRAWRELHPNESEQRNQSKK